MFRLDAPWTEQQVEALNAFQVSGMFHPYTCPDDHPERVLRATRDGWVCPGCDYTQPWAHPASADPDFLRLQDDAVRSTPRVVT